MSAQQQGCWPPSRKALSTACQEWLGTAVGELSCLCVAPTSAVLRAELVVGGGPANVVVKLYRASAVWKADRERNVIDAVSASPRLTAPRVLAHGYLPAIAATALVLEDRGAATLQNQVQTGQCSPHDALRQLGRVLREFHTLPPSALSGTTDVPRAVASLRRHLPEALLVQSAEALTRAAELASAATSVSCHGDLHLSNVLAPGEDGRTCLIDFEEATTAPAEYDVAQTIVTTDAFTPDERSSLLSSYDAHLHAELLDQLTVFHALRGWLYAAVRENRDVELWNVRLRTTLAAHTPFA